MPKRYNHVFSLAFEFITDEAHGDLQVPDAARVRTAILRRLASLPDHELIEALGCPEQTSEE